MIWRVPRLTLVGSICIRWTTGRGLPQTDRCRLPQLVPLIVCTSVLMVARLATAPVPSRLSQWLRATELSLCHQPDDRVVVCDRGGGGGAGEVTPVQCRMVTVHLEIVMHKVAQ